MDKKAFFLFGDVLAYIYSLAALLIIGLLFLYLFASVTPEKLNPKEYKLIPEDGKVIEETFQRLGFYLYYNFIIDGKETSLNELIPLYCYNKDNSLLLKIQSLSLSLLPERSFLKIYCAKEDKCYGDLINKDTTPIIEITTERRRNIGKVESIELNKLQLKLPSLSHKTTACLEFGVDKLMDNSPLSRFPRFFNSFNTDEDQLDKIPVPKSLPKSLQNNDKFKEGILNLKSEFTYILTFKGEEIKEGVSILSPTKEIWLSKGDEWCNPVKDLCKTEISTEKLIECLGDSKLCF